MWVLYILSWIAFACHLVIITLCIASGLYYLAELVEEYTVVARKIIQIFILSTIGIYVFLLLFDDMPWSMIILGLAGQCCHLLMLQTFPYLILSPSLVCGVVIFIVNHYLAFLHFTSFHIPFSHIMAYFTLCLWMVPFCFFVSLTANENVLPTVAETRPLLSDDADIVTSYFSRKQKKYSLLSMFQYAKETMLPQRVKKVF